MELTAGSTLGPYQLVERVGVGGLAEVWRAHQPSLRRDVALKVPLRHFAADPDFSRRLRSAAEAAAGLYHPNILAVLDVGEQDGVIYLVTPFVAGGTLAERLGQPWSMNDTLRVLEGLASALDYAHARGIVHRDVKPSTVLLTEQGTAILGDFGLIRALAEAGGLTGARSIVAGTPTYMSPEQVIGEPIGPASDLYSLGVIAYELLTGQPPFRAETSPGVMLAHVQQPVPPPRSLNPGLSEAVEAVLFRALAKRPAERYPSGSALVTELASTSFSHYVAPEAMLGAPPEAATRGLGPAARPLPPSGPWAGPMSPPGAAPPPAEPTPPQPDWAAPGPAPPGYGPPPGYGASPGYPAAPGYGVPPPSAPPTAGPAPGSASSMPGGPPPSPAEILSGLARKLSGLAGKFRGREKPAVGSPPAEEAPWRPPSPPADMPPADMPPAGVPSGPPVTPEPGAIRKVEPPPPLAAPVPSPVVPGGVVDRVHFTVTSPHAVQPGTSFLVDVWAHLEQQREAVIQRAHEAYGGREIQQKSKGPIQLARDTVLTVLLHLEGFTVDQPADTLLWAGEIANATFLVGVPGDLADGRRPGLATIHSDGLQIARIYFEVQVRAQLEREAEIGEVTLREERHRRAFVSYASADRDEVLPRIQGIQKAVPGLEVFLDVLTLRSGQYWEQELWKVIPSNDVFYLFWSANAKRSEWVEREWRCALQARGLDFIDPVPLVAPDEAPPPPELSSKHFNDWTLLFRQGRAGGQQH